MRNKKTLSPLQLLVSKEGAPQKPPQPKTEQDQTAAADLNGLLAALGVKDVDEALEKIEQLRELDALLDWLTKADAELVRNWDQWRVGFGLSPMTDGSHYQTQDDDWKTTEYFSDARTALLIAFHRWLRENPR